MHRIASLDVDSESDIDWKSLRDPMWNLWSSHCLQSKWRYMKASLNNPNGVVSHRGEYKLLILPALYIRILDRCCTWPCGLDCYEETLAYGFCTNCFHALVTFATIYRSTIIPS